LASIDARFTPDKDDIDPSELAKSVLEMDADYRRADPKSFLFSGIRVGEVLALGDFPNYAALSEVPLPEPLEDFDINATLPRPYRPFRWPYHQTMGEIGFTFTMFSTETNSAATSRQQSKEWSPTIGL